MGCPQDLSATLPSPDGAPRAHPGSPGGWRLLDSQGCKGPRQRPACSGHSECRVWVLREDPGQEPAACQTANSPGLICPMITGPPVEPDVGPPERSFLEAGVAFLLILLAEGARRTQHRGERSKAETAVSTAEAWGLVLQVWTAWLGPSLLRGPRDPSPGHTSGPAGPWRVLTATLAS